jgi:uncharacterized protein (DUF3820 family)
MTDESLFPFGEHKGKKLANVPASFLFWLYMNEKCYGELKDYIEDNLDIIKFEIEKIENKKY